MISDSPKVYRNADKKNSWKPKNYGGDFEGDISVRHCLTHSKNTCSIQIAESVGAAQIRSLAQALGVESRLPNDLTISLGSGEVLPLELTNAYATLATGGRYAPPVFLARVQDRHGEKLFASKTRLRQVISPDVAFLTTSLMRSVVEGGTAASVRALGRGGRREDGDDQRAAKRLVHWLHAGPRVRDLHWVRQQRPDGARHDRRRGRCAAVVRLYEGGGG